MPADCVLCLDFGAGSARLMAVFLQQQELCYCELHRFANQPQQNESGELLWREQYWLEEIRRGLALAAARQAQTPWRILSIGIDTWGCDLAYFDAAGKLLQSPYCYRDSRTEVSIAKLHQLVSQKEMYAICGNAYFPFNSVYQLYHDTQHSALAGKIAAFAFTPDFLLHLLGGQTERLTAEYCIASTSGLCDARQRNWSWPLIDRLRLPRSIFPCIVEPPQCSGSLAAEFWPASPAPNHQQEPIRLLKVPSHDTAAASASIAVGAGSCFLVCGTWFILGQLCAQPCLGPQAQAEKITNEGAGGGMHRVQKLFCGFWLLQQLRKEWGLDYDELAQLAGQSGPDDLHSLARFSPDEPSLSFPSSMQRALQQLLQQAYPPGQLLRIVYYNMARTCAQHLHSLEAVTGQPIHTIYAVGGGRRDAYFVRLLQETCGCQVRLGPVEASVLGNAAWQFLYSGKVSSLAEFQQLVANSPDL